MDLEQLLVEGLKLLGLIAAITLVMITLPADAGPW
jgi:hypothetical protein